MGAVSITCEVSNTRLLIGGVPAFDTYYEVLAEKILSTHFFIELGDNWYESWNAPIIFRAPGWVHGYSDDDVARTPRMVRKM